MELDSKTKENLDVEDLTPSAELERLAHIGQGIIKNLSCELYQGNPCSACRGAALVLMCEYGRLNACDNPLVEEESEEVFAPPPDLCVKCRAQKCKECNEPIVSVADSIKPIGVDDDDE